MYRFRKRKLEPEPEPSVSEILTPAQRTAEYRIKLKKSNPEKFRAQQIKDKERSRQYRVSMSEEQRRLSNEKAKIRMREYRKRKGTRKDTSKCVTRRERERQRESWREQKKKQRLMWTPEQKDAHLKKRRERYRKKIEAIKKSKVRDSNRKNRLYLPKDAKQFNNKIEDILSSASPEKLSILKNSGLVNTPSTRKKHMINERIVTNVKRRINFLKWNKSKEAKTELRLITKSINTGKQVIGNLIRKEMELKWDYWVRNSMIEAEKDFHQPVDNDTNCEIESFYYRESVPLPGKRTANAKSWTQKSVLVKTIDSLWLDYKRENPTRPISLSHFRKLRPKSVLTVKKNKFNTCLCEYCVNVEAKIKAINKRADELHTTECKLKDRYEAVKESLCISQSDQFPYNNMLCIKRECDQCGDEKVKSRFEALLKADETTSEECKWQIWENQSFKDSTGNSTTRKVLKDKEGRLEKLIDEFIAEIHSLAEHLFIARWQYTQFNSIRSHVPDKWVVTIADFSENYRCSHQDEIQSAYYQYSQATVHPIVAYYNCPSCQNCIVEESSVFISPDLKHDAQAVNQFTNKLLHHIQEKGVDVNHVVQYSDGCSAQYKSKGPFLDVSKSLMSNDFTFERSYFGSRHGKGPCDALGGIVKKCAETSVKSRRRTIRDAKELYKFCEEELTISPKKIEEGCEHKIRTFFYESNIKRHNLPKDLKTLVGTRKLHNVRTVEPGEVEVRNLSCYCSNCQKGNSAMCSNTRYVTPWVSHVICSGIRNKKKTQKAHGSNVQFKPSKENFSETGNELKSTIKESSQKVQGKPGVTMNSVVKESTNNVTDRKSYFGNVLRTLQKNTTFDGLKADANRYEKEISSMEIEGKPCSVLSLSATVDRVAHSILPSDIHEQDVLKYPVINGADGNCLPRCGSVYSFGNEENHEEIRARIVIESVQHCNQYLDYKFLCRGTELTERSAKQLPSKFAMYSPIYCPGVKLTAPLIREIFEKETISIAKSNTYMGIWQLFALASVLNCSIYSVYPNLGNPAVREDLNRCILPRGHKVVMDIYVMWTTTRSDMVAANWIPNHFVPVLPMNVSQKDTTSLLDEMKDDPMSGLDLNIQSLNGKTEKSLDDSFTSTERDALETLNIGVDILDFVDVPEAIFDISSSDTKPPPADMFEIQMPRQVPSDPAEIQMPLQVPSDPAEIQMPRQMSSDPAETQMPSDPVDLPEQIVSDTKPPPADMSEIQMPRQVPSDPAEIQMPRQMSSDPAEIQMPSDPVDLPEQIVSDTKPPPADMSEIQMPRQVPSDPAEIQMPRQMSSDPAEIQMPRQVPSDPAEIQMPLQVPSDPAETQMPLQVPSDPAETQMPRQVPSDPAEIQMPRQMSSDPAEIQVPSDPVDLPEQIVSDTKPPPADISEIQMPLQVPSDPAEIQMPLQVPSDPVDLPEQIVSYHSGDFVLIRHGSAFLPGVVDHWPWVKYFCQRKKLWILNDTKYTVAHGDIWKKLEAPEICAAGSRLYYKFKDHTKRKQKLQQLVESIMATKRTERKSVSKSTGPYTRSGRGRGRRSEYKVPIGWQHFSKEKYRIVMQRNGGGTRYIYRSTGEEITVNEIIEEGKALYFKDGKSKFGSLEEMTVSLVTSSGQEISDFTDRNGLSCCFTEYVKAYGLYPSQCHLYLRTKVIAESDTDTCLGKKEQSMCFLVNNGKAGTLAISYEKTTQSVYNNSTSSISVKSYRTCMSLAKEDLEDYNVFEDGYTVNGVWKDNREYLVDKENVYNFPQMSSDPNEVVCFIHGPDVIHGSETDDLGHLIIGCLTIFHNKGHLHNWYKDSELVDSGINHCILRIAEPGTYTVEVVGSQSVTFASVPLSVRIDSEKTYVTETLMTQQNQSNVFSGQTLQQTIAESAQTNQSSVFSGQTLHQTIVENAQQNQSNVFSGHMLQQTTVESAQPNQSNVFSGQTVNQIAVECAEPIQPDVFAGQILQQTTVESAHPNRPNVFSGQTLLQTTVECAQPNQSSVFSGQTLQQTTVETAQPNQSNVFIGQALQRTTVENVQPNQSNMFSGHILQETKVKSAQPNQSNTFSGQTLHQTTVESAQPNQSNTFSGQILQQTTVESAQPYQPNVFLGHILQKTTVECTQPNQPDVFSGHILQPTTVESAQPDQSDVFSGQTFQQTTVESAQSNQSNVFSGQTSHLTNVESGEPNQSNVFSGQTLQQTTVESVQSNQSNVFSGQTSHLTNVESGEPNQSNMFSGQTLQKTTVECSQSDQSNVFSGQTLHQTTVECAQPNQSNVVSGLILQQTTVENAQSNQSNVFSAQTLQQTTVESAQSNQSNMFSGQTSHLTNVESGEPNQSNVFSGQTLQKTTVECSQSNQSNVFSGQTLHQTTVECAQPNQSNVVSGLILQQTTVENAQSNQSNVFSAQTSQQTTVESAKLNESDMFREICVPRITMDQVQLYEQIGQGAFGTVFRGNWLGTVVAVKRITVKRMRLVRSMVIREITVHSRVHHPNIVQLMAFAIEGSELNLISEYVEGRNLDEILFSDESCVEMCIDKKTEICRQILRAVAYLHNQTPSIIHRDIKPENILVSNDLSKVYVCDMGLSKIKTMNTLATTFAGGEQPGTPAYKAPELETGSASAMSDVWSLSCTLLELFIEDCVWRSDMDEKDIKQQKIKRMDPDGLKTFLQLNNISNNIKDTIRNGLSYLPLERPTALEMLAKFSK